MLIPGLTTKSSRYQILPEYLPLAAIVLIFFIVYFQASGFALLDWDDDGYIRNVPDISSFNAGHFFTSFYLGNYHPLTCISWAVDYGFWTYNGKGYHLTNMFFHALNIGLVYLLIRELFSRKDMALVVAALFAFHPMHVESVAWVSERKDVLYGFFFLLALLSYLQFNRKNKAGYYYASLLCFILSLLSKPAAMVFPLVLLLIDYFRGIRLDARNLLMKVPFFVFSVLIGIVTMKSQQTAQDYMFTPHFPWFERIFIASYALFYYFINLFLPLRLSALHPYPVSIHQQLPVYIYLSILFVIAILLMIYLLRQYRKLLLFGSGFFLINLLLVLQLIPVGKAMVAERYSYLPYLGIFAILAWFLVNASPERKRIFTVIFLVWMVFLIFKTYTRLPVWKDSNSLYTDIIINNPQEPIGYYNRGLLRFKAGNMDEAYEDYSQCLRLEPENTAALWNRSLLSMQENKPLQALDDLKLLIKLDPENLDAHRNSAVASAMVMDYAGAERDFSFILQRFPNDTTILLNRGVTYIYLGSKMKACVDFTRAMQLGCRRAKSFTMANCNTPY